MFFRPSERREEFDKLVVRTHFGDVEAWQEVLAAAAEPWDDGEVESTSLVIDDRSWEGATIEKVTAFLAEKGSLLDVVFVADESSRPGWGGGAARHRRDVAGPAAHPGVAERHWRMGNRG